jgi:hypothetical protein
MCGPCTTGESAELFPEEWIPPHISEVNTDAKMLKYWQKWYVEKWLPSR